MLVDGFVAAFLCDGGRSCGHCSSLHKLKIAFAKDDLSHRRIGPVWLTSNRKYPLLPRNIDCLIWDTIDDEKMQVSSI
jgi:hypothetical protein